MAISKTTYINTELKWAEEQLSSWKTYIDEHPLHTMTDRIEYRQTKTGTMPMVIASIEAQGKFIQETMKNYLALLEVVEKLREKEVIKVAHRGTEDLGTMAEEYLEKRK